MHIIAFPLQWKERQFERPISYFRIYQEGEIVFVVNMKKTHKLSYFCYDITRKTWREFQPQGLPIEGSIQGIYIYKESLFPLLKSSNSHNQI